MIYANSEDGKSRIRVGPKSIGRCLYCNSYVSGRLTRELEWHWYHEERKGGCDPWTDRDTKWHIEWKDRAPEQCRERVIRGNHEVLGDHRGFDPGHRVADIYTTDGLTVRLRSFYPQIKVKDLNVKAVSQMEGYFGRMLWLFNIQPVAHIFNFDFRRSYDAWKFTWQVVPRYFTTITHPFFLDFGGTDKIFQVFKIGKTRGCVGEGRFMSRPTFAKTFIK